MQLEPATDPPVEERTAVLDQRPDVSRASKSLALVLDDLVHIPGTDLGVGLDGVVGLIPGIGDATTTTVAAVILGDAVRNRVPLPVLGRMGVNLGVDALLGLIPGLGDLFDVAHRANRKNLRLLQRSIDDRQRTRQRSVVYLIVAISMVVGILVVLLAALLWSLWLLWQLVTPR